MVNITTPLLIIGAALPRTGTMSIMAALERMGYKFWHGSKWTPTWFDVSAAADGDSQQYKVALDKLVEELSLQRFDAILDQPGAYIYPELMEYYPHAKVLNTVRDRDAWAKSMVEMAYNLDLLVWQPPHSLKPHYKKGRIYGRWMKRKLGITEEEIFKDGVPFNGTNFKETQSSVTYATCAAAYDRYQAQVKKTVPPDRLVVYSVKEGWGPLCRHFLKEGTKCPDDEPFPSVNSKEAGYLLNLKHTLQLKIHLYKIHPVLARDWLVSWLLFLYRWRTVLYAIATGALTILVTKATSRRH